MVMFNIAPKIQEKRNMNWLDVCLLKPWSQAIKSQPMESVVMSSRPYFKDDMILSRHWAAVTGWLGPSMSLW